MLTSGCYCDKCGNGFSYDRNVGQWLPGKTTIIRWARKDGWSIGKQTLCPTCRKPRRSTKCNT